MDYAQITLFILCGQIPIHVQSICQASLSHIQVDDPCVSNRLAMHSMSAFLYFIGGDDHA
jgi:hypothetical protein